MKKNPVNIQYFFSKPALAGLTIAALAGFIYPALAQLPSMDEEVPSSPVDVPDSNNIPPINPLPNTSDFDQEETFPQQEQEEVPENVDNPGSAPPANETSEQDTPDELEIR